MSVASDIIDQILIREGSEYTNDPTDAGGPTKYGITLKTLTLYRGHLPTTAADVEALTEAEARAIYTAMYVAPFQKFPGMQDSLLGLLVDSGVQHGEGRAMQWLQSAIGAKPDGEAGPATLASWAAVKNPDAIYKLVLKARIMFYAHIIHDRPDQVKYINGWFERVCLFI
jgi:lysozyme family protein